MLLSVLVLASLLIFSMSASASDDSTEAQGVVDKAKAAFNDFMADSNYSWLQQHIKDAEGLLIFPQIIKGGFFLGGSGGTGVLVVRDKKSGEWSQPAFYTAGSVTIGLQIGGEAAEVVVLIMERSALDSLFTSSVKLGGDASVAVGPVGGGAKEELPATFISFSKSKGLYAGLNLESSVIAVRDSLNKAYYGRSITPLEIIVEKKASNQGSAELLAALKRGVK